MHTTQLIVCTDNSAGHFEQVSQNLNLISNLPYTEAILMFSHKIIVIFAVLNVMLVSAKPGTFTKFLKAGVEQKKSKKDYKSCEAHCDERYRRIQFNLIAHQV